LIVLDNQLAARFGPRLRRKLPLANLTSFRIGGAADLFVTVEDAGELAAAMAAAHRNSTPVFCLGAGTNLLVSDRGIRGLVVRLGAGFASLAIDGTGVSAGGGMLFRALVEAVVARGLRGLEFGEGIPGTVGGGLVMNAGAFGGEIARVVTLVHGVTRDGERRALTNQEVGFAYRRSALPPGFVITRVDFTLEPGAHGLLWQRVHTIRARRAASQPCGLPNAGSVFKNPAGNYAGRLLENAGLKGSRIGNAAFSCQHSNFIVNLGGATASDVHSLIELARDKVKRDTGIVLELELRLVGDW